MTANVAVSSSRSGALKGRWDEEAALSSPQVVCGLRTDSRSKGGSGHGKEYQRDDRMRPGRQGERDLCVGRSGEGHGATVAGHDAKGDDGILREGESTRRDRGRGSLALG